MIEIEVTLGKKKYRQVTEAFAKIEAQLDELTDRISIPLSRDLRQALKLVAEKMQQLHGGSWTPAGGGDRLQRRSGEGLASIERSISVRGAKSLNALQGRISSGKMSIHETGGTIRAKSNGYLTIPLPAALDQRGVPLRKRAREWNNTFVARSKKGNLLIFQKKGRNNIVPLYVLKKEVSIRPRLGLQKSVLNDALPYFERKVFERVDAILSEG